MEAIEERWDEASVLRALEKSERFGPPAFAFLAHVHGRVSGQRSADGVAVGLWHSRGLMIQGIEVKTSRSDWLRELKKPDKADKTVFRFCDRWWLVTPRGTRIVGNGELPGPWGHAEVDGRGVHVVKEAPQLEPDPVDRPFVAELFRRAVDQLPTERLLSQARREGHNEGYEEAEKRFEERSGNLQKRLDEKTKLIESFEKVIGTNIGGYLWEDEDRASKVRRALKFVLENGHEAAISELKRTRKGLAETLADIDRHLAEASPVKLPEGPP